MKTFLIVLTVLFLCGKELHAQSGCPGGREYLRAQSHSYYPRISHGGCVPYPLIPLWNGGVSIYFGSQPNCYYGNNGYASYYQGGYYYYYRPFSHRIVYTTVVYR